jgi:glycosyltransferase involved in cell wall biosynthesis
MKLRIFPASRWLDHGGSLHMVQWLRRSIHAYDVVHIHALFNSVSSAAAALSRRAGVPYIVRPLGTLSPYTFSYRRSRLKRAYFGLVDRALLDDAHSIHFTAPQEAEKASRLGLTAAPAVIPIPYASDYTAPAELHAARDIVFMGRLDRVKGLDLLFPAFALVHASIPEARLVIAGSGEKRYEAWLRNEAARLGITTAVRFAGFIGGDRKEEVLRGAAVFCLPSYQENFGVAIVEALGAGVPVVITRGVDLWPSVAQFESGLVVEPTVAAIAEALSSLLRDPSRRRTLGRNGLRQVQQLYAPAVVGRELADLYRTAARSRMRPSASVV